MTIFQALSVVRASPTNSNNMLQPSRTVLLPNFAHSFSLAKGCCNPRLKINARKRNVMATLLDTTMGLDSFECEQGTPTVRRPKLPTLTNGANAKPAFDVDQSPTAVNSNEFGRFLAGSKTGNVVPIWRTLDLEVTMEQAMECMAARTDRPIEIVVEREHIRNAGLYTVLSAPPSVKLLSESVHVTLLEHRFADSDGQSSVRTDATSEDPVVDVLRVAAAWQHATLKWEPCKTFFGGWVDRLARRPPESGHSIHDEGEIGILNHDPEMHIGLVDEAVVIDHAAALVHVVHWVHMDEFATPGMAFQNAVLHLQRLSSELVLFACSSAGKFYLSGSSFRSCYPAAVC